MKINFLSLNTPGSSFHFMEQPESFLHDYIFDVSLDRPRLEGYITGFFDGEGHVGLYIYKGLPKPVLSFSNDNVHVLNFIQYGFALMGIDFRIYRKSRQLKIQGWKDENSLREVVSAA